MEQRSYEDYFCLHFPGAVENVEDAIDMVGGMEALEKGFLRNGGSIILRFRPSDVDSHGIHSDVSDSSAHLFRVRIKKRNGKGSKRIASSHTIVKSERLGAIRKIANFSQPFDFQYLGETPDEVFQPLTVDVDSLKEEKINMQPVVFSRSMREYDFEDSSMRVESETVRLEDGTERRVEHILTQKESKSRIFAGTQDDSSVDFKTRGVSVDDESVGGDAMGEEKGTKDEYRVPTSPPPGTMPRSLLPIHDEIRTLFEVQPIWVVQPLLAKVKARIDAPIVPKVYIAPFAYNILNGPFCHCWVRYGVDVRSSSSFVDFQLMDFRLPYSMWSALFQERATRSLSTDSHDWGSLEPSLFRDQQERQNLARKQSPLFDIFADRGVWRQLLFSINELYADPFIATLVKRNTLPSFDPVSGYLTHEAIWEIRQRLRELYLQYLKVILSEDAGKLVDLFAKQAERVSVARRNATTKAKRRRALAKKQNGDVDVDVDIGGVGRGRGSGGDSVIRREVSVGEFTGKIRPGEKEEVDGNEEDEDEEEESEDELAMFLDDEL
eukprot:TRINITY_DN850_c2_g1_i1.p1 TRINITY_DN850_c2_g1~~TRINITY_DN850_c2_g1_i1.p1  ORF type:complete len:572 (+),score=182.19 TRINITY_DN850_c2_g1_i1:66-1718(+)